MKIPIRLEKPLRRVVQVLEKNDVQYAIVGGIALSQWGAGRATMDVDFKVLVPNYQYDSMRQLLRAAFPNPARPHLAHEPLVMSANVDQVVVDFLFTVEGYEELAVQRAVRRKLNGWSAAFATAEDLIIQKVVAGRDKDWPDVADLLLAQFDALDYKYIRAWLQEFAAILEERDFSARFEATFERVKRLKKKK